MNNNEKSKAIALAGKLVERGTRLSQWIKQQIEFDSKYKIKRSYKKDFDLLDEIITKAKKLHNIIKQNSPGYFFAEQNDSTITKFQAREGVLSVAKQLKNISAFLLKKIEQEKQLLIEKDYSALLKKLESSMKLINGEIKLYKDESTWLFAENKINYEKNEGVRYQIGWKVPLLGRLVDALELQIQKENKENAVIDHTKLLIKLVNSLKSFDEDLKLYGGTPNAPTIQTNKLLNKLTSSNFGFKGNYQDVYGLAGISVNEAEFIMSECDSVIPNKLPEDRNEFHKIILAVQKKENLSYAEALNLCRYGKK